MFAKFIPKNIQEKLKAKERALDWQVSNRVLDSDLKEDIRPRDIASRNIFVRMCSNKDKVDNILISGGEVGPDGEVQFGGNAYKDYSGGDKVRPIAGIKDIQVEYKGGYKALREATINWTVFSLQDLDRLAPYFLTVGKTIALDWGWSYSKKQTLNQQLGIAPFITKDVSGKFQVNQNIFNNPQEIVQISGGDYDAIGGQITNFEYNLREDGGFDCVTKIISLGVSLFQLPIDAGGRSASSVETKVGGQVHIPPDDIINAVINLREIIIFNTFGVTYDKEVTPPYQYSEIFNSGQKVFDKHNIYFDRGQDLNNYAIYVDNKNNPNVMWQYKGDAADDIFVTWGWMEDQLLNRYLSFAGGEDNSTKLTVRSLDTVIDKDNLPISREDYEDSIQLFYTPEEIYEQYGVRDFDEYQLNYPTPVLKKPTKITNYPLLWPKELNRFFMLGSNFPKIKESNTKDLPWFLTDADKKIIKLYENIGTLGPGNNGDTTLPNTTDVLNKASFSISDDDKEGELRKIWVNIKEIQKAFGISNPDDTGKKDDNNINPPGTLERALTILLKELNNNFHDAWNFELVVDPYDSTNLKVIDVNTTVKKPNYTKFTEGSKDVSELGIYQFPAFTNSSMVKSQNLAFKIPNSMAITTLYGSNATGKDKLNRDNMNHTQLFKLFKGDKTETFSDKYLNDLESSYLKTLVDYNYELDKNENRIPNSVGNQNTDPNSQIRVDEGELVIDAKVSWWRRWFPNSNGDSEVRTKESKAKAIEKFIIEKVGDEFKLQYVTEGIFEDKVVKTSERGVRVTGAAPQGSNVNQVITSQQGMIESTFVARAGTGVFYPNQSPLGTPSYYSYDEDKGIILSDDVAYAIRSHINADSPSAQFVRDSVLPAELSLVIDGMGGLVPGDLVHTSYIQDKYKTVISVEKTVDGVTTPDPHGPAFYFQIWGHTQTVSAEGWTTQLETKMRYNSIPDMGKTTYEEADAGIGKSVETKPPNYNLSNANTAALPVDSLDLDDADNQDPDDIEELLDELNPTPLETAKKTIPEDRFTLRQIQETTKVLNSGDGDDLPDNVPIEIVPIVVDPNAGFDPGQDSDIVEQNLVTTPTRIPNPQPVETKEIEKDEPGSSTFKWNLDPNRFVLGNSAEQFPLTVPATSQISALPPEIKKTEIVISVTPASEPPKPIVQTVQKTQMTTEPVSDNEWINPTVVYVEEVPKGIRVQPTPSPSVIIEEPELVILKSTYDGNAGGTRIPARGQTIPDSEQYGDKAYLLAHNYTLMYQLTKWNPNGAKAQVDFYGEGVPSDPNRRRGFKILQKYRQKFWDEIIEAPNETGISEFSIGTPEERLAKMRARRDEIGDRYQNLGPYDTWTPITGIPIAVDADGNDIILPTAP